MSEWRMKTPCGDCPLSDSPGGRRMARSLRPGRVRDIKRALLQNGHFLCHKTTSEAGENSDGDVYVAQGGEKLCAGAIAFQDRHGVTDNYRRICERVDAIKQKRAGVSP